jgi:hypothetical protein
MFSSAITMLNGKRVIFLLVVVQGDILEIILSSFLECGGGVRITPGKWLLPAVGGGKYKHHGFELFQGAVMLA